MGRAIVRNPTVPVRRTLSNLDAKLRVQMRSELKELHQRLGYDDLCHPRPDRSNDARRPRGGDEWRGSRADGPPLDLYDKPQSLFVAAFIGSPPMNFVEGNLMTRATS
jgi:multiple sugar transport system ATP-binding protein